MSVASLPRIVRFLETVECDACPHCGANGRWVHRFVVEDGRTLGAMSGCIKLFPISPIASEAMRLDKKAREYAALGWKLNRFDTEALDLIESAANGLADVRSIEKRLRDIRKAAASWRRSRFRRSA